MKSESKYFSILFVIFSLSAYGMYLLSRKYINDAFYHLVKTCNQFLGNISSLQDILSFFVIGAIFSIIGIFLLKTILSFIKTERKIKEFIYLQVKNQKVTKIIEELRFDEKGFIVFHSSSLKAFTFGFLNPKIAISDKMAVALPKSELKAVILHERYHQQRKHPLFYFLGEIINGTLFFLPIISFLVKRMRLVFEEEADAFVVTSQGTNSYLRLALAHIVPAKEFQPYPNFSSTLIESRVNTLLGNKEHMCFPKVSLVFSSFVVILFAGLLWEPVHTDISLQGISSVKGNQCPQSQCLVNCRTDQSILQMTPVNEIHFTSL